MNLLTARELEAQVKLSTRTMHRLRLAGKWELGIHYFRISPTKILYNLDLIDDWIANLHQIHLHENAIASFLESLPSNDRPMRTHKKAGHQPARKGVKNNV